MDTRIIDCTCDSGAGDDSPRYSSSNDAQMHAPACGSWSIGAAVAGGIAAVGVMASVLAAGLSEIIGVVIPPGVAGPEVENVVVAVVSVSGVAEPGVAFVVAVASVSGVAEPGVAFVVAVASVSEVAEPEVAFVVGAASVSEVAEPGVAFVALASVADGAEPQVSVDIALAFAVSVPVSVVAVEVDSPVRPRFLAFPNVDYYASSSSSVEVVG